MKTFYTDVYVLDVSASEVGTYIGSVSVAISAKNRKHAKEKLRAELSKIQTSMAGELSNPAKYRFFDCIGLYNSPDSVPDLGLEVVTSASI